MKIAFMSVILFASSVFAQVTEEQVKNFSFAGAFQAVYEDSDLEIFKDQLTLQTDAADIKSFTDGMMQQSGVQVLSAVFANQETGLIVAAVKQTQKANELAVLVFDTAAKQMFFYNISEISEGLIRSRDPHYSDLLIRVTKQSGFLTGAEDAFQCKYLIFFNYFGNVAGR